MTEPQVAEKEGTAEEKGGTAEEKGGTVEEKGGTVEEKGGTVEEKGGTVEEKGRSGAFRQVTVVPSRGNAQGEAAFQPLFAKGYNDLILRSYDELGAWQNYLHDNPRRLMMKRAKPEWLRPFFDLRVGSHTYNGIGNRQLLSAPQRMAVRLSRRLSESDIDRETQRFVGAARQGAVLISPAISPGEKHVMRAAFNANLPTVVLMSNGFTPLSKPRGEQFYACAKGHLLMLSPWEHHNEKKTITAQQCTELNLIAQELCAKRI